MGAVEVIGDSGPLQLTDAYSTLSVRTASGVPEFTLRGTGTLTVPPGGLLEGCFTIAGGAVLTITGGNTLTVRTPNQLTGTVTDPIITQLRITAGTGVEFYSTSTAATTDLLGFGNYRWSGTPASWH